MAKMSTEVLSSQQPQIVAILKPFNVAAKAAFHQVAEAFVAQKNQYADFMHVDTQTRYDAEVARALMDLQDDLSDSATDPSSSTEEHRAQTMATWTGHYVFDLLIPPTYVRIGWLAGKVSPNPKGGIVPKFVLAQPSENAVRAQHARFNYNVNTGFLGVSKL